MVYILKQGSASGKLFSNGDQNRDRLFLIQQTALFLLRLQIIILNYDTCRQTSLGMAEEHVGSRLPNPVLKYIIIPSLCILCIHFKYYLKKIY